MYHFFLKSEKEVILIKTVQGEESEKCINDA